MPFEEEKAAVRRFFQDVWNDARVAEAASFLAPEFVSHNTVGVSVLGPAEYGRAVLSIALRFLTW